MAARSPQHGFTLVELVVTMTVGVIVASFAAHFVGRSMQGFVDQSRRAELVDAADSALSRMARDVRRALPNSIRTAASGSVAALELIGTVDGARYRAEPPGGATELLDVAAPDDAFRVLGAFTRVAKPFSSTSHHLAIYNVGVPGADAYELANVMTPAGTRIDIAAAAPGEDQVTLSPPFRFAYHSPARRVYLVDGPVSYLCDAGAGTLVRYQGYALAASHAARDSHAELVSAGGATSLMAEHVSRCRFAYVPGTAERAGLLTIEIEISEQGERVALLEQVHVSNAP